jgi:hypothetical protein
MPIYEEEYAIFDDRASADTAVRNLTDLGYTNDDISVMMSDKTKAREFTHETGGHAETGAVTGAAVGASLGGVIALLTATGSVVAIAGTGGAAAPVVAGPLVAALAGLGAGGVAAGILGGLIGLGIPEHKAKRYAERLNNGGILLGVKPRSGHRDKVREILPEDTDAYAYRT